MYETYWGLTEKPFRNAPDPRYLYLSPQHEEAYSRLVYGIGESLGLVLFSGLFGCGKTLLLKKLAIDLEKERYRTAYISNPQMSPEEILSHILYKLTSASEEGGKSGLLRGIEKALLDNYNDGRKSVIIIDEAHVIDDPGVFEELRMLLNLQAQGDFLMSLVLSGQPEISDKIRNIKQIDQRVGIRASVENLEYEDTRRYISCRLSVAGGKSGIFTDEAIETVFRSSNGIPRRINSICDLSLLAGYTGKLEKIDSDTVTDVVTDLI